MISSMKETSNEVVGGIKVKGKYVQGTLRLNSVNQESPIKRVRVNENVKNTKKDDLSTERGLDVEQRSESNSTDRHDQIHDKKNTFVKPKSTKTALMNGKRSIHGKRTKEN